MRQTHRIGLVCLDIDGTLTSNLMGPPLPGAVAAVTQVARDLPVRYVTNATSRSHRVLFDMLSGFGFPGTEHDLWTPATAARHILAARDHTSGMLLCDHSLREDLHWFTESEQGAAVLLGTEAHDWRIADLQPAFRRLLSGGALYALQQNRFFRRGEELVTDVGPVAAFLSYAAQKPIQTLGKPSPLLFDAIATDAGVRRDEMLMVGDDVEFDVASPTTLGLRAVLVRTGKYRPGDEDDLDPSATAVIDSIEELPGLLG